MERYQLILAYDGTEFEGFQRQGRGRTVQAEVENALRRLNWQGRVILSAGRTDTGVHASGQVVAFDLDWKHTPEALARALNANLPGDVAVVSIQIAAQNFHPRFDATARRYRYRLYCRPDRHPLLDRFRWRVWPAVNLADLQTAARLLRGTHDFSAFGAPMRPGGSTVRTVYQTEWGLDEDGMHFTVTANAFLYHMVRRMVYVQVQAAQHRLGLDELESGVRQAVALPPGLADPQGLCLIEVLFERQSLQE